MTAKGRSFEAKAKHYTATKRPLVGAFSSFIFLRDVLAIF